jgi:hypothetical protein
VSLRDFIYLDTERLRSFVAQAAGGLISEKVAGRQHEAGATASGKAKVPLIAEVGGDLNYRYVRSESETKSLHDYIFEEFRRYLVTQSLVTFVPEDVQDWSDRSFADGQFLEVSGVMKLIDFQGAVHTISIFPKVVDLAIKSAQMQSNNPAIPSTRPDRTMSQQMKTMPIKEIGNFVNEWYGDDLRLKLFPFPDSPDRLLVGRADRSLFRYKQQSWLALMDR